MFDLACEVSKGACHGFAEVVRDISLSKVVREDAAQVVETGLGARICECLQCRHLQAVHATNVDDPSWITILLRLLKQRRQQLRDCKDSLQIEGQDPDPRIVRILVIRGSPIRARIVDEYVQVCLPLGQLLGELLAVFQLVEIGGDGVGFPRAHLCELGGGFFAGFGVAGGDVDLCAVLHVAFADHATDAFGTTSDKDDFVLDVLVGARRTAEGRTCTLTPKRVEISMARGDG